MEIIVSFYNPSASFLGTSLYTREARVTFAKRAPLRCGELHINRVGVGGLLRFGHAWALTTAQGCHSFPSRRFATTTTRKERCMLTKCDKKGFATAINTNSKFIVFSGRRGRRPLPTHFV